MKTYVLEQSPRKNKRFRIKFDNGEFVDFGADGAKTFIDGRTEKEREAWIARHKDDRYYNDKRSGIYHSRMLLWTKSTLRDAVRAYERMHNVKLVLQLS